MNRAFSLVELSIVLVILGLLVGGVLSGQSLIHAAELRAVTGEYQRYAAARNTFRDKYFAVPGDMNNATAFWGKDNTNCPGDTGTAAATGTCNGNGDGQIMYNPPAGPNGNEEPFQFWRQLQLAGLIEGTFSGVSGSAGPLHTVRGSDVPGSKLANASWTYANYGVPNYMNSNDFIVGADTTAYNTNPILNASDAWNIDTKTDDGMPWSGRVEAIPSGALCVDVSGSPPYPYMLNDPSVGCALYFVDQ